jgi:hypothetical protein
MLANHWCAHPTERPRAGHEGQKGADGVALMQCKLQLVASVFTVHPHVAQSLVRPGFSSMPLGPH